MSASASKSVTNTPTTTTDNRVGADNGAIVLGAGAQLVNETLADDVAETALDTAGEVAKAGLQTSADMAETAARAALTINADSLDFAGNVVDGAAAIMGKQVAASTAAVDSNSALAARVSELAIENMEANKNDATAQTVQEVAKYAATAAAAAAGIYFLSKTFKK
ncbi:MAG TPA: hypothetical protein PK322_04005 [Opitutaceae bacterium]|nr:hypothetical protein [Opitutaceae bacterium]